MNKLLWILFETWIINFNLFSTLSYEASPATCKSSPACVLTYSSSINEIVDMQMEVFFKLFKCSKGDLQSGRSVVESIQSQQCVEVVVQLENEDASGQKKESATILYRNPIPPILYSQNVTCKDICSLATTKMNDFAKSTDDSLINLIKQMRNNKDLVENVQVGILIDTLTPLISLRQSAAMLYFGCTTRTNGNDHDVSDIVTDMKPFDCSSMPPKGDGPAPRIRSISPLVWIGIGVAIFACIVLAVIGAILYIRRSQGHQSIWK
jgi:hypothetical protein